MRRFVVEQPRLLTAREEAGTGLVGTAVGVFVFLAFLLLATQVLLGLYTTSLVTSAAVDAATSVAHADDPMSESVHRDATARARRRLGAFARQPDRFDLDWSETTGDEVVLTVHARTMTLLPPSLGAALGNRVDRTVRVRTEQLR